MSDTGDNFYSKALGVAWDELEQLSAQERAIAIRKAQLRDTVNALYPLVFGNAVDIGSLNLPDALRLVLRSAGRPLNSHEFKTKLDDIGFNLEKYSDPVASILTAMNRMVEAGEMVLIPDAPRKTVGATPELKQVPEVPSSFPAMPISGDEAEYPQLKSLMEAFTREEGGSK